jgi:hypothetical protein
MFGRRKKAKIPLACRMGLHQMFGDTVMRNIGSEDHPVFLNETTMRCNYCPHEEPAHEYR